MLALLKVAKDKLEQRFGVVIASCSAALMADFGYGHGSSSGD